jgi:hypothetical protein
MSGRPRVVGYTFSIRGHDYRISLEEDGSWHAWMGGTHVGAFVHPQLACDVLCRGRFTDPSAAGQPEVTMARMGLPYDLSAWDVSVDG